MKNTHFLGIDDARRYLAQEVAVSEWLLVEQDRINNFADATGDQQWIHVDVERAKRESPYGAPIAHGYLTLSLMAKFAGECLSVYGVKLSINYGLNRVRFMLPVKVDSRIRARFLLLSLEDIPGGCQLTWQATIEIEDQVKPACVAEMLVRWYV